MTLSKQPILHEVIERERRVLELRLAGVTWDNIAQAVGYASRGAAYAAYQRGLKRTLQEPSDEIRVQERERLDRLTQFWYPKVFDPNSTLDDSAKATEKVLKIMERRAKYLGLDDQTVKHEVTINEGGSEIDERVRQLAQLVARNRIDASGLDGGVTPSVAGNSEA